MLSVRPFVMPEITYRLPRRGESPYKDERNGDSRGLSLDAAEALESAGTNTVAPHRMRPSSVASRRAMSRILQRNEECPKRSTRRRFFLACCTAIVTCRGPFPIFRWRPRSPALRGTVVAAVIDRVERADDRTQQQLPIRLLRR
jgi:hypothetical protein